MNDREQLLLEQWRMASQFHLQMDNNAWRGASYFVAIHGILLGILGTMANDDASFKASLLFKVPLVAIPFFGAVISGIWAIVQRRAKLYACYRMAQAKQAEEALTVDGERILTLHEKGLNEQELDDPCLDKFRVYLRETWLGRQGPHELVFGTAVILAAVWIALLPLVLWYTFRSAWVCVLVSLVPAFLWLWLVWDACLLPRMKRPTDQADA